MHRYILAQLPRLGRFPSRQEIAEHFYIAVPEVEQSLARLHAVDLLYLDPSTHEVRVAYPFSTVPTNHLVRFIGERRTLYAQCAVDALGISFLFQQDVSIRSVCEYCGTPLFMEVRDGAIMQQHPAGIMVWGGTERSEHAATSICPTLNFFCSSTHALEWRQREAEPGEVLNLGEALSLGQGIFGCLLTSPNEGRAHAHDSPKLQVPTKVLGPASSAASIVAAFLASVCCIGPLVLTALGVGIGATGVLAGTAGFLKALLPYRPWFIGVTVVLLGIAFFVTYRAPKNSCSADTNCGFPQGRRRQRVALWIVSAIATALMLAPYWLGL
jgi:mercuric ion transport protein